MRNENIICSTSSEVLHVVDRAKIKSHFKSGQSIFYAGSMPLGMYTVVRGLIKLEVSSSQGHSHTVRIVGPGGVLGYRSLLAGESYQATAVVMEDADLCFIPKSDILALCQDHPTVAIRLLEHLSKDLNLAEKKWMNQVDQGAPERVAESLIFLQENFEGQDWTRREIAQWAGTTPETVIRTLAQFERDGLIDQKEGRQIKVLDLDRLKTKFRQN